jgi:general stress protein 26
MQNKEKESVIDLVKDIKYAMLVTNDQKMASCPMATAQNDSKDALFFISLFDSDKVNSMLNNPDVLVNYSDVDSHTYLSINGKAKLIFEKEEIKKHWSFMDNAFFKDGIETPDICLIKVEMEHAQVWKNDQNFLERAINLGKGILPGKTAKVGSEESVNY